VTGMYLHLTCTAGGRPQSLACKKAHPFCDFTIRRYRTSISILRQQLVDRCAALVVFIFAMTIGADAHWHWHHLHQGHLVPLVSYVRGQEGRRG
jgi:hypothetical protein